MYLTCQNWKWCHLIKRGTQFSGRKGFHIYDLSILLMQTVLTVSMQIVICR